MEKLLDEILSDIFHYSKNPSFSQTNLSEIKKFDSLNEFMELVNKKSMIFPLKIPVFHIKVKEQYTESLCGFHALFYSKIFLKAMFKAKNEEQLLYYINKISSNASFWKFYTKTLKKVLNIPFLDNIDREDLNKMGPLDSSHLDYLVENGMFKKFPVNITSIFYGYGYFQCGVERIRDCQEKFKEIFEKQNGNSKEFVICFLGITSHWMCFIQHKSGSSFFFDSRNNEHFLDENKDLQFLLEEEQKERQYIGKKPLSEKEIKQFLHNMRDGRFIFNVFIDRKFGKVSFLEVYINRLVFDLIRSFEAKVYKRDLNEYYFEEFSLKNNEFSYEITIETKEKDCYKDQVLERYGAWIKQEKCPKVIREDVLEIIKDIGKSFINEKTRFFLLFWLEEALELNKQLKFGGDNIFKEIEEILKEIQIFLKEK